MVYKHAVLLHSTFMLSVVKMLLKEQVGGVHQIVIEISSLIMEKSWNCVFEFLWEPCVCLHNDLFKIYMKLKLTDNP